MVRQLLNISVGKIIGYDNSEIDLFNLKNELKSFQKVQLYFRDILDQNFFEYIVEKEKIDTSSMRRHINMLAYYKKISSQQ